VAHICVYGVLGAFCYRGLRWGGRLAGRWLVVLVAALLALAYGMSDEFHQMFVPNRSSELLDLAADLVGGTLGALVASSVPWLVGAGTGAGAEIVTKEPSA
jgi:VanZ family protein